MLCIIFHTARHAASTDAILFHGAKTPCYSLGNPESIIIKKKDKKKRATKATLPIIRVHLLVLLWSLGVRGVTPFELSLTKLQITDLRMA
jgi:hypothetical protein